MSDTAGRHFVVVGGGLAAARCCEHLRRLGHHGRLTVVSAEDHLPYDRPPLSKAVLTGKVDDSTLPVDLEALDVDLVRPVRAVGLRTVDRVLETSDGEIPYDGLVVATGAVPVRLPGDGEQLTLRTIDDARRLRARLVPGARVVIVGASWIGAEVATAALSAGCRVTCVEAGPVPAARSVGEEVGKRLLAWWSEVDLRLNVEVQNIEAGAVALTDGTRLNADVVVVGVGVRPATEWLEGSGIPLTQGTIGGILVDEWMRAAPGVVAVGDVAVWWSRRWNREMNVEHWDDAAAGAAVAAAALLEPGLAGVEPHDPVPYFWSDQFGHKLQYVGAHSPGDALVWRVRDDGSWSAFWLGRDDRLTAALVTDLPRENIAARIRLTQNAQLDPELLADPAIPLAKAGRTDDQMGST